MYLLFKKTKNVLHNHQIKVNVNNFYELRADHFLIEIYGEK